MNYLHEVILVIFFLGVLTFIFVTIFNKPRKKLADNIEFSEEEQKLYNILSWVVPVSIFTLTIVFGVSSAVISSSLYSIVYPIREGVVRWETPLYYWIISGIIMSFGIVIRLLKEAYVLILHARIEHFKAFFYMKWKIGHLRLLRPIAVFAFLLGVYMHAIGYYWRVELRNDCLVYSKWNTFKTTAIPLCDIVKIAHEEDSDAWDGLNDKSLLVKFNDGSYITTSLFDGLNEEDFTETAFKVDEIWDHEIYENYLFNR